MEQQSHSFGISENLSHRSIDKFHSGTSIKHAAERIKRTSHIPEHIVPCQSYPDSLDGYEANEEAYSDGMDVIGNIVNEDHLLPCHVLSKSDDYDYPPLENINYDYLNQSEWHQDDFYNGANLEVTYLPQCSTNMTNYISYFCKGTMYFIPHQDTSNSLYTGHATYAQFQPGLKSIRINRPDVAHVEVQLNSTYSENSRFDSTTKCHKETTKAKMPQTDATNAEPRLEATNAETPSTRATDAEPRLESANAETPSTRATDAEPRLEATNAETPSTRATDAEPRLEATNAETPRTRATDAEPRLEATNAEIPNIDYTKIKTSPGTAEAETFLEKNLPELADTLSECLSSNSSNAELQPNASNSNSQCISKTSYAGSLNSNNISDGQNSRDYNSCEHVDSKDGKNLSDHVENGGQKDGNLNVSSNANRRNKKKNSRKGYGNNSRQGDSSDIHLKFFNSRQNGRSISDCDSLDTKHLNDRNNSNGLEKADDRQGSRRNNSKTDARYRDFQSSKFCNRTCSVHCENGKSPENKTSGASSEVTKKILYSSVLQCPKPNSAY